MPKPKRVIAIGDIHGCIHALVALLEAIQPSHEDQIVVLGDFIDQGHETRSVIDRLIELGNECQCVCLMGNHEEMLLAAVADNEGALQYWLDCGGQQTINSYRFAGSVDDMPSEHLRFINACRDYYETDTHIFVHANFDPACELERQPIHTLRWELLEPDEVRCHKSGKKVILGHTEQRSGEVLDLGCVKCIDTACWRYGWLTGIDVCSGHIWQASRFGHLRQAGEPPVGEIG